MPTIFTNKYFFSVHLVPIFIKIECYFISAPCFEVNFINSTASKAEANCITISIDSYIIAVL